MNGMAFATWLAGVGLLDKTERRQALAAVALAETSEADARLDQPITRAASIGAVLGPQAEAAAEKSELSGTGNDRIARFGCPHCGCDGARPWGRANAKPRYRCVGCRRTFNPLTGTPLAGLHYPDRWTDQAHALINHETISNAAKRCDIHYTTAFRWRHRFLSALNLDQPRQLPDIVGADETLILDLSKGRRSDLPHSPCKRGGKASKPGISAE